jgi:hypothetical protein
MERQFIVLLSGLLAASSVGCGSSGVVALPISGTVTFGGNPVADGYIVLKSLDGDVASDAGKILDGKFQFQAKPGTKRVEIDASQPGPIDSETGTPIPVSSIPVRYNTNSNLTVEVRVGGTNHFDFDLEKGN